MNWIVPLSLSCLAALVFLSCRRWLRSANAISINNIRGPKPESFVLGNLRQIRQGQAGHVDFQWQHEFGALFRIKAPLGENRLMLSDPKAIQHIFQSNVRNFQQPPQDREILRTLLGPGIAWADADTHRRHRRAMTPAFGVAEMKTLMPLFRDTVRTMIAKWHDLIAESRFAYDAHNPNAGTRTRTESEKEEEGATINVPAWVSRATLDIIGQAAFDYHIGALENVESELGTAYENVMADGFALPTSIQIFAQGVMHLLPPPIIRFLFDHIPARGLERLRGLRELVGELGRALVSGTREKTVGENGRGDGMDVLSLLVKANACQNDGTKLSEEEMLAQVSTIMFAGHETTACTISWALYELAKHPHVQDRVRAEIRAARERVRKSGEGAEEFDRMVYLACVVKEVLRMHPVGYHMIRQPRQDDVLPLYKPIRTVDGEWVSEVAVAAGTKIIVSVAAYQRNKDVWGTNAHVFDPERWLNRDEEARDKAGAGVGIFGNLMVFSAGLRSCLGWRMAVLEIQMFLVDLIDNFEFSLTEEATRIRREPCLVMVPMVEGQLDKGVQLPLKVRIAPRD